MEIGLGTRDYVPRYCGLGVRVRVRDRGCWCDVMRCDRDVLRGMGDDCSRLNECTVILSVCQTRFCDTC